MLVRFSDISPEIESRLAPLQEQFYSTSILTHEGCATAVEFAYLETVGADATMVRVEQLPLRYRLALSIYHGILFPVSNYFAPNLVINAAIAVGAACLNTPIFDRGRVSLLQMAAQAENDWTLNPDARLERLAELPVDELATMMDLIQARTKHFADEGSVLQGIDMLVTERAVEAWIARRRLFKVCERMAHPHRSKLVSEIWNITAKDLRVDDASNPFSEESQRFAVFSERVENTDYRVDDATQIRALASLSQLSSAARDLKRECVVGLSLTQFSRSDESGAKWLLCLNASFIINSKSEGHAEMQTIGQPNEALLLGIMLDSLDSSYSGLESIPIAMHLHDFSKLTRDETLALGQFDHLFVHSPILSIRMFELVQKKFGPVTGITRYSVEYIGPEILLISLSRSAVRVAFLATPLGAKVAQDWLTRTGECEWLNQTQLPMNELMGVWPRLYGVLRGEDSPTASN